MILTQKYSSCCRGIRNNSLTQIFFEPANLNEVDHILAEHSDKKNKAAFLEMLNYCWAEPYSFIIINTKKRKNNGRYSLRFEHSLELPS